MAATGQGFPLMIGQGGMRRILELAGPPPLNVATVGRVRSQFAKPPDDFDGFTQSLVCVDYESVSDEMWKQTTLRDICGV